MEFPNETLKAIKEALDAAGTDTDPRFLLAVGVDSAVGRAALKRAIERTKEAHALLVVLSDSLERS